MTIQITLPWMKRREGGSATLGYCRWIFPEYVITGVLTIFQVFSFAHNFDFVLPNLLSMFFSLLSVFLVSSIYRHILYNVIVLVHIEWSKM